VSGPTTALAGTHPRAPEAPGPFLTLLSAGRFHEARATTAQIGVSAIRILSVLVMLSLLTGSASGQSTADIVKRKQDAWMRCLRESYGVNRKRTPDRSAAMEMAFQACGTEEDDLWAYSAQSGMPRSSFLALKSATKQVILEGK